MIKSLTLTVALLASSAAFAADLPQQFNNSVPLPMERPVAWPRYWESPSWSTVTVGIWHTMHEQNLLDSGYNPANDRDQYGNMAVH